MSGLDVLTAMAYAESYCFNSPLNGALDAANALAEARDAVAALIAANKRTIRAFESLGRANGVIATLESHRECESALVAQKDALARIGGAP